MKLLVVWVLGAFVLPGVLGRRNWYENAVIYQIYPRSFLDTDGDGIGDLTGIIKKADYLQSLGVDAVWLSPIYPSPNVDYGYDISDFMDINPEYGTLNDFDNLVRVFKDKGIRVILDFVPNHSSTEHKWFKMSEIKNDTETNYSDFYVWKDAKGVDHNGVHQPPNNWLGVIGTGSAWKWSEKRKQFYLHNFLDQQADLNYNNPNVKAKMLEVLKFWMKRGAAGFRVDAVSWLYEDNKYKDEPPSKHVDPEDPNNYGNLDHIFTMDQPANFGLIEEWRDLIDSFTKFMEDDEDRIMVVESYSTTDKLLAYYGTPSKPGATFPFNFLMLSVLDRDKNAKEWADAINSYYHAFQGHSTNWVLGNHDQRRVADRWSEAWVDLLHLVMMTLRGTAVSYYGEEIGLTDNSVRWDQQKDIQGVVAGPAHFRERSRDFERGPMPWNPSSLAGFSNGSSTWLPLAASYWQLNVDAQEKAEKSHLKVYRALVQLRKSPTLAFGDCEVKALDQHILYVIRSQKDNPTVLTVVNIGDRAVTANLHDARGGLPDWVRLLVASANFPDQSSELLEARNITLPAKSGIVVATAVN